MTNKKNLKIVELTEKHPFTFTIPITQTYTQDGKKYLEGLASTTDTSLSRHKQTQDSIKSMKQQAIGLPGFMNHDENQIYGNIVNAPDNNPDEFTVIFELLPPHENQIVDAPRAKVQYWLDNKVQLGMSIGGTITRAKYVEDLDTDEWWFEVEDLILHEVSVTPIPAVQETKGRTQLLNTCKGPVCSQIYQSLKPEIERLREESRTLTDNIVTTLEENTMTKDTKIEEKIVALEGSVSKLTHILEGLVSEKEEAQKKAELEEAQKVAKEQEAALVKEVTQAASEAAGQVLQETLEGIMKQRPSAGQPSTDVEEGVGEETSAPGGYRDPVNYPAVVAGKVTQGYTPRELFGVQ